MTEYDYIKRATLVGDVLTSGDAQKRFREMTGEEAYFEFLRRVGSIPAADVAEVRRGRWIATAYTTTSKRGRIISNVKYTCSECEWGNGRKRSNYCAVCGARMDGGAENA